MYLSSDIVFLMFYFIRSYSPRGRRSPRPRSITPPLRGRSNSRSPPYRHARRVSPYANGYALVCLTQLFLIL